MATANELDALKEINDELCRSLESARDQLLILAQEFKTRIGSARCFHCGATIPLSEGPNHWRTCAKHPARLEIERLRGLLAESMGLDWDEEKKP